MVYKISIKDSVSRDTRKEQKKTYSSDNMKGNEDRNSSGRSKNEVTLDR